MCRIVGFVDYSYQHDYDLDNTSRKMRDTLTHGGPDSAGTYIDKHLSLGHRRLSILDLSSHGHQPMEFENLVITFNGEVYNFKEIRRELQKFGYSFHSDSDTEVILKAYHKWGKDAVHRFRGMFAFGIYNKQDASLVLYRDRMGVKPLYWYFDGQVFMFASELKAFHQHPKFKKELNSDAISLYLQHGYIKAPGTIFQNTYKLEPGHFLIIDENKRIETKRYWDMLSYYDTGFRERDRWLGRSESEIADELEGILQESFDLRMVSDVPVGVFLSGGIDSSLVTALLQKSSATPLKTFTIGFHEKGYNEAEDAKKIASHLGTDHTELYCTPKEAFEIIPKIPDLFDEPMADSSIIPTYLVSQLARKDVKVALSADGGDEVFCGYTRFWYQSERVKRLNKIPFKQGIAALLSGMSPETAFKVYNSLPFLPQYPNFKDKYSKLIDVLKAEGDIATVNKSEQCFIASDLRRLGDYDYMDQYKGLTAFNGDMMSHLMYLDSVTYLPDDILTKVDRATMAVALEGREPLLDHKILEYAAQLPNEGLLLRFLNGLKTTSEASITII